MGKHDNRPNGRACRNGFGIGLDEQKAHQDKMEAMLVDLVKQVTACATSSTEAVKTSTLAIQKNTEYLDDATEALNKLTT